MTCENCAVEMHFLCLLPTEPNCCCESGTPPVFEQLDFGVPTVKTPGKVGRPQKAADDIAVPTTSGRKRAVEIKKAEGWLPGQPCEWTGLKFAGGGVKPIIGCSGNDSRDVHHGPDKNTLNNDNSNIHAICSVCHKRWHTLNDEYYIGDRPSSDTPWVPDCDFALHDSSSRATETEISFNELDWLERRRKSRIAIKDRKD